jgi:hypothetical protein
MKDLWSCTNAQIGGRSRQRIYDLCHDGSEKRCCAEEQENAENLPGSRKENVQCIGLKKCKIG